MKKKTHLTREQRYQISALLQSGSSQKKIAEIIGKDKSGVSREIRRNSVKGKYHARLAHELAMERKERFARPRKFTEAVRLQVEECIRHRQYSPEQIVGLARRQGRAMVSHERIYQHIRQDKSAGGDLYKHLRHRLKHRRRSCGGRIPIKGRVPIDLRPPEVDARSRFGDWEIDTIVGKDGRGAIVTIVERTTAFMLMERLPAGKQAEALAKAVVRMLFPYRRHVRTITADNGTEFAHHKTIARKLGADFYFCHPYSAWERGLGEYTNRLVRQYIPKGTDFTRLNDKQIKDIQYKINLRPRKKLGFDNPKRVFFLSLKL